MDMDNLQDSIEPSMFRLPDEAVAVVRKMMDPSNMQSYVALEEEFKAALPEDFQGWFVDVSFAEYPWSYSGLALHDYLVAFDGLEQMAAVVSLDEVLLRKDFHEIMKENGMNSSSFLTVWLAFEDVAPKMEGVSLRERAVAAVGVAKEALDILSVKDVLVDAENRAAYAETSRGGRQASVVCMGK